MVALGEIMPPPGEPSLSQGLFSAERIARWRKEILESIGVVSYGPGSPPPAALLPTTSAVPLLAPPRWRRHRLRNSLLVGLGLVSAYSGFFFMRLDRAFPQLARRLPWPVAYAGGRAVSWGELQHGVQALARFYQQQGSAQLSAQGLEHQAFKRLLQDQVLNSALERARVEVSDALVEQAFQSVEQGFSTSAEFENFLYNQYGWSAGDFKNELLLPYLKRQLLERKLGQDTGLQAEAESRARTIRASIIAGNTTFAQAATAASDDQATAGSGGDLGWVDRTGVAPELSAPLTTLRVGEVSEPIKTTLGYELVTILQLMPGSTPANDGLHLAHILIKPVAIDRWLDQQVKSILVIRLLPL